MAGQFSCAGASFDGVLIAEGAIIERPLFWTGLIGPERTKVHLTNASVAALVDDVRSWPAPGNLILDGFVYQRISAGPRDAKSRLKWLGRQVSFATQSYRQLAKVLRDEGDDSGARRVLFTMEYRLRRQSDATWLKWSRRIWGWMLLLTVGYGYYPALALLWLLVLTGAGAMLYRGGYFAGSMAPTGKEAYACFQKERQLPPQYERFHASIYSLENVFPLVKLGQADRWQPDPNPLPSPSQPAKWSVRLCQFLISARFLWWFRWAQISLGWFFATMGVAGVTGIVRKD